MKEKGQIMKETLVEKDLQRTSDATFSSKWGYC